MAGAELPSLIPCVVVASIYLLTLIAAIVFCWILYVYISRSVTKKLESLCQSLRTTPTFFQQAAVPPEILAIFCEHHDIPLTALRDIYTKETMERSSTIQRTFGQQKLIQQYLPRSKFLAEGYNGEGVMRGEGLAPDKDKNHSNTLQSSPAGSNPSSPAPASNKQASESPAKSTGTDKAKSQTTT